MPKTLSVSFEVAEPKKGKKRGARLHAPEPVEAAGLEAAAAGAEIQGAGPAGTGGLLARVASGQPLGFADVWTIMQAERAQAREDAKVETERLRQQGEQRQQQDREFMGMMMQILTQGRGGGGVDMNEQMGLIRRELALQQRESLFQIRREVRAVLDEADPGDEPEDPAEPIESLEEAGAQALGNILREVTKRGPGLLDQLIGALRGTGVAVSQTDEATLRAAAAQNGSGTVPRA